jgi:hypothetical protein
MEAVMDDLQQIDEPPGDLEHNNLFEPLEDGEERGYYPHHVSESSLYTKAALHPVATALLTVGAGAIAALLWGRRGG